MWPKWGAETRCGGRCEPRGCRITRDANPNVPLPLVTSALHTREARPERAGALALTRCTRDLRERVTFALRAVTLAVTADMVLCGWRTWEVLTELCCDACEVRTCVHGKVELNNDGRTANAAAKPLRGGDGFCSVSSTVQLDESSAPS